MKNQLTTLKYVKTFSLVILSTIIFSSCSEIIDGAVTMVGGFLTLMIGIMKIVIIVLVIGVIGIFIAKIFGN